MQRRRPLGCSIGVRITRGVPMPTETSQRAVGLRRTTPTKSKSNHHHEKRQQRTVNAHIRPPKLQACRVPPSPPQRAALFDTPPPFSIISAFPQQPTVGPYTAAVVRVHYLDMAQHSATRWYNKAVGVLTEVLGADDDDVSGPPRGGERPAQRHEHLSRQESANGCILHTQRQR